MRRTPKAHGIWLKAQGKKIFLVTLCPEPCALRHIYTSEMIVFRQPQKDRLILRS